MDQLQQPKIHPDLLQRLRRIAAEYEMSPDKMLGIILAVSFDELEGKEDEYTVYAPTSWKGNA